MDKKFIILCTTLLTLCGCSTYPSKFKCSDSRGLGCTMLSNVDRQIDSGEINEVYLEKSKCTGKNCLVSDNDGLENKPVVKTRTALKVKWIAQ